MNFKPSRHEKQLRNREELKRLLQEHGILQRIHSGYYRYVIEENKPAREPSGRDVIISYYDGDQYVCTKHRVIVGIMDETQEIHQDVEAAVVGGILYERSDAKKTQ